MEKTTYSTLSALSGALVGLAGLFVSMVASTYPGYVIGGTLILAGIGGIMNGGVALLVKAYDHQPKEQEPAAVLAVRDMALVLIGMVMFLAAIWFTLLIIMGPG